MGGHLVNRSRAQRSSQTLIGYLGEDCETKPWRMQRKLTRNVRSAALLIVLVIGVYISTHYRHETPSPRMFPVMVQSLYLQHALALSLSQELPKLIKDRRNRYWIDHGVEAWKIPAGPPEGCIFLNKGASDHYLNCNEFHNIDLTDFWLFPDRHAIHLPNHTTRQSKLRHVGEGGFRNAFYFSEYDGTQRVLKTLSWRDDRSFDMANMDRNRKDAVIATQLTSSPLVANIYGYCSQSALFDYSTEWDMDYIFDEEPLPIEEKLFDLAVDISQAIADSHLPDEKGRATVVHMDLKPDQFIELNGRYVLNDFNLAKFITYNEEKGEYCNQASGYSEGRWQAPEQFTADYPRTEKADIYSMGYILNFLLTQDEPFPDKSSLEVQEYVMKKGTWEVPLEFRNSTNSFHVALTKAITDCLQFVPEDRPSAKFVADFLRAARDKYKQERIAAKK